MIDPELWHKYNRLKIRLCRRRLTMKDTIYAVVVTIFSFLQDELIMYTDCSRIKEKVKEGNYMAATTPTQIRIEENTKKQAVELLEG